MPKVENGRMVPSSDALDRLSRALGLDEATSHEIQELLAAVEGASDWEATLDPAEWTPRELRHSFVSLLSDRGVPLEEISRLVGHSGTAVTEEVYRKQIRPVIQTGAVVMDGIFGADPRKP